MTLQNNNHFDLARFAAATLVLFSHSFALSNQAGYVEPLAYVSGNRLDCGSVAVAVFFAMSGFLITGSWLRKGVLVDYLSARVLRIMPGLALALLLSIAMGAVLTVTPQLYPQSALSYFIKNFFMYKGQGELAGVFQNNLYNPVVNGSLWTLRHEFTCYLIVAALGMAGLLRYWTVLLIWAGATVCAVFNLGGIHYLQEFFPLLAWFMAGALVYFVRERRLSAAAWAGMASLVVVMAYLKLDLRYVSPALAFALIRLIYQQGPLTRFGKYGDFSYGMYIFAFPIQQLVSSLSLEKIWWQNFLLSFPLTLVLAILSWHFLERPCLKLKDRHWLKVKSKGAIDAGGAKL
jgi:peptidoglycan/LPS O-acetylase OafA/YrhL